MCFYGVPAHCGAECMLFYGNPAHRGAECKLFFYRVWDPHLNPARLRSLLANEQSITSKWMSALTGYFIPECDEDVVWPGCRVSVLSLSLLLLSSSLLSSRQFVVETSSYLSFIKNVWSKVFDASRKWPEAEFWFGSLPHTPVTKAVTKTSFLLCP